MSISIQKTTIVEDLFVLAMSGAKMVLGIQWLGKLGPVTTDHKELSMEFWDGERKVRLQGGRPHLANSEISKAGLRKVMSKGEIAFFCQLRCEEREAKERKDWHELTEVLKEYGDVLAEPHKLSSDQQINHQISLMSGSQPINVHPYRYPHYQKNEIERLTREMLSQELIKHSISPFASPVLLVKKKDGSWRFCIDYRALNAVTIRDRFSIPTMDELLDELHGVVTKLNLRPGYHQIRITGDGIENTVFRTHQGHYDFIVMPFGLSNAPATITITISSKSVGKL